MEGENVPPREDVNIRPKFVGKYTKHFVVAGGALTESKGISKRLNAKPWVIRLQKNR
jgi:hypothetical protein